MKTHPDTEKSVQVSGVRSLSIFLVIFITIGCDEGNDPAKNNCLLTKSNATYSDRATEEYNFIYNSDNLLIKWISDYTSGNGDVYTYSSEYTYDLNGNVIRETYNDGHVLYFHDNDRKVVKEEYFDNGLLKAIIENEYNINGQITERQHYIIAGVDTTLDYYSILEYSTPTTKNIQRIKKYSHDGTLVSTTDYLYDSKINPWTTMGFKALFAQGDNNITRETRTEETSVTTYSYTYEYTDNDYPSKLTYTNSAGNNSYTEVYTYDCK